MKKIDLNCDMGESFGAWTMGNDEAIMPYISSANIACGFHAGDARVMRQVCELALKNNVAIGAHIGFPDLQGFGRRNMNLSAQEIYDITLYQLGALYGIMKSLGGEIYHVKPHGALYNMAAKDKNMAKAIINAVKSFDTNLILYGLSGSFLVTESYISGLRAASEVFADRTYQDDGTLTPRNLPNSLILKEEEAINQVLKMINEGVVISTNRKEVAIQADTICIHGDGIHALKFTTSLREKLTNNGIIISKLI